jgi:hypothetical protein
MQFRTPTHRNRPVPRRAARRATARAATLPAEPTWTLFLRPAVAALLGLLLALLAASRLPAQTQAADTPPRAAVAAHATQPDPTLGPAEVVASVLEALAQNDQPTKDRGIEVTFSFSSPANRAMIGPVDRFGDLVREEVYRPLLYHSHAVQGTLKLVGDRAQQRVIITSATGERVVYTFTLSRQADGPFRGCWMTDGVTREPPSALGTPRFALAGGRAAVRRG